MRGLLILLLTMKAKILNFEPHTCIESIVVEFTLQETEFA